MQHSLFIKFYIPIFRHCNATIVMHKIFRYKQSYFKEPKVSFIFVSSTNKQQTENIEKLGALKSFCGMKFWKKLCQSVTK